MRATSADAGQETWEGSQQMDWGHPNPLSPPPFMLLQMPISVWGLLGEKDENISFVFLSLWGSQGARGQKGSQWSFTLR